jgi:hypothetical protein
MMADQWVYSNLEYLINVNQSIWQGDMKLLIKVVYIILLFGFPYDLTFDIIRVWAFEGEFYACIIQRTK